MPGQYRIVAINYCRHHFTDACVSYTFRRKLAIRKEFDYCVHVAQRFSS